MCNAVTCADVPLLQLLTHLRCPKCRRTLSTYNIIATLRFTDVCLLQQKVSIAAQQALSQWPNSRAAVEALILVRSHLCSRPAASGSRRGDKCCCLLSATSGKQSQHVMDIGLTTHHGLYPASD